MRKASVCSATPRSCAGVSKKYCVTLCVVWALKLPPRLAAIAASWSLLSPGLPRNIMCSSACAVPGNPAGASSEPTR